jgi:prepilin-type N-terminal cleavage/methylation domain-containing protein
MRRLRRPPGSAGFTLVEALVAVAVLGLTTASLYTVLFNSQKAYDVGSRHATRNQSVRAAMEILVRDLRSAGSGWGATPVFATYEGAPIVLFGVTPHYSTADRDSVFILGALSGIQTTISQRMPQPSSELKVSSVNGFEEGDLCIITDGTTTNLFMVTAVQSSALHLQHNPAAPWNPPGGLSSFPPGGYAAGSRIHKIDAVLHYLDTAHPRGTKMMRKVGTYGVPQIMADEVVGMQFLYHLSDGVATRDPGDVSLIRGVTATLVSSVPGRRSAHAETLTTTVWPRSL